MKMLTNISIFNFFSDVSRDVRGVLGHHHWCLGRDLGPSVINFFSKNKVVPRTSGNDLISILALSVRQEDASGTHLGPFSFLHFVFIWEA